MDGRTFGDTTDMAVSTHQTMNGSSSDRTISTERARREIGVRMLVSGEGGRGTPLLGNAGQLSRSERAACAVAAGPGPADAPARTG